ncbi:MAG TPA: MBL fold metallo-hydrolase [Rhodospirillaceae bacterium]|nr:MBL fold metallo-hydrolase [Rhodospirillaceae bacterium]
MAFPWRKPPSVGCGLALLDGLIWLRMPLPFALDHVNLWLMESGQAWALVDTGISDQKTREAWRAVFSEVMGGRPLERLVVSHFHPDHMGLAAWLERQFGVSMETPRMEWLYGRMLSEDKSQDIVHCSVRFYRAAGFDDDLLAMVAQRGNAYGARVKHIPVFCRCLNEGDLLLLGGRRWSVMLGEGHTPAHACLWCAEEKILISGDQILPSISPNISVWPSEPDGNPLAAFMASLVRFRALPDDCLVLPSHGLPFRGLHHRIDQLLAHHEERLAMTAEAARQPVTAYQLLRILFDRPLDNHQLFFAQGESLAHLHCLMGRGEITRETDAKGVHHFRRR